MIASTADEWLSAEGRLLLSISLRYLTSARDYLCFVCVVCRHVLAIRALDAGLFLAIV